MLHIVNGGAAAEGLQRTSIPGAFFAWPEVLSEGPPGDAERRAEYLEQHHLAPRAAYLERMQALHDQLAKAPQQDEVVLWFEDACWFCQANLLGLLAGAVGELRAPKVSLVLRPGPMGAQQGQGQYEDEFHRRAPVRDELRALTSQAWGAYASADPRDVERLLERGDFAAWPFLPDGLRAHLERFPSTVNGLNAVEALLLKQLDAGPATFGALFARVREDPSTKALGLGDPQAMAALWALVKARQPLASTRAPAPSGSLEALKGAQFDITPTGKAVLRGAEDHVMLNGIDRWLGGVELLGRGPVWRWDPLEGRLRAP